MQVQGIIAVVQARIDNNTNAQRFWQAHGKTNYVYDMTVNGPSGPVSGEISSQTPNVYPKSVGAQITVNVTNGDYGTKLSAVQDQQYGNQQQQPQQGQQQQAPPQDNIQDRIQFAQALNLAVSELVGGKIEEMQIKERARIYYHILKSRAFPLAMSNDPPPPQQQQPVPQQQPVQQPASPQFDPNAAFDPTDNIPF